MPAVLSAAPGFRLRRLVGLVEQIELELGGEIRRHALRAEPGDLRLQHGPRAVRDRLVMMVIDDVAEDQRGPRQPRDAPERREIGLHGEVAVALFPIGDGVARHRLHVDVVGEQIVAAVGFLVGAVEKILGLEALADQPSLHVGKAGHDRIDLAGANRLLQLVETEISGHTRLLHPCDDEARAIRAGLLSS